MAKTTHNSRTWTLRFKHHTTTILLHADPIQKLSSLRAELLLALQHTNPSGTFSGHRIPDSADEIILARPVDRNDLSAGWERLERSEVTLGEDTTATPDPKGKGKARVSTTTVSGSGAKAKATGKGGLTDCPQGVGLRDNGIVAFRFKSEDDEIKRKREDEMEKGFEMAEEDLTGASAEKGWDVVVPTIEETYAEEDAAAAEAAGRG